MTFITRKGFFTIVEDETELYRIVDKSLKRTLGLRMFGLDAVIISCRDTDTPVKEVISIKRPREFMDLPEIHVDAQRDKYNTVRRDIIPFGRRALRLRGRRYVKAPGGEHQTKG